MSATAIPASASKTPGIDKLADSAFNIAVQILSDGPLTPAGSGLLLRWRRPGAVAEALTLPFDRWATLEDLASDIGADLRGRKIWAYAIIRELPQYDDLDHPWVRGILQVLTCSMMESVLSSFEIARDYETARAFRVDPIKTIETPGFEARGVLRDLLMPPLASRSLLQ